MEDKANGIFIPEGSHDVLAEALGTDEKYGRVRGIGGFVKPQVFFGTARKTRSPVAKALADSLKQKTEEADSLKSEVEKLKAELAAEREANSLCMSSKKSSNSAEDADGGEIEAPNLTVSPHTLNLRVDKSPFLMNPYLISIFVTLN